jgi:hypothetical protein
MLLASASVWGFVAPCFRSFCIVSERELIGSVNTWGVMITDHFLRFYPSSLRRQATAGSVVVVLWSLQQIIGVGLLLVKVLYLHKITDTEALSHAEAAQARRK